jgi:hypothetical protein
MRKKWTDEPKAGRGIGGWFYFSPAAIPSTDAEVIGQMWPAPIVPTAAVAGQPTRLR